MPSSTPPVSAAPTWPKNLRRLGAFTALLADDFPVSFTFTTSFFSFIVVSCIGLAVGHCVRYFFPCLVNYKKTVSILCFRWVLLCKNCHRRWHCGPRHRFRIQFDLDSQARFCPIRLSQSSLSESYKPLTIRKQCKPNPRRSKTSSAVNSSPPLSFRAEPSNLWIFLHAARYDRNTGSHPQFHRRPVS